MREKVITKTWSNLRESVKDKPSARYINLDACRPGKPHPMWAVPNSTGELKKTIIKARLLVGSYRLQVHRARFNQHPNDICPLCEREPENRLHFLVRCETLHKPRLVGLQMLQQLFEVKGVQWKWLIIQAVETLLLQLLLDCSELVWLIQESLCREVERITQTICFDLHTARTRYLAQSDTAFHANTVKPNRGKKSRMKKTQVPRIAGPVYQ